MNTHPVSLPCRGAIGRAQIAPGLRQQPQRQHGADRRQRGAYQHRQPEAQPIGERPAKERAGRQAEEKGQMVAADHRPRVLSCETSSTMVFPPTQMPAHDSPHSNRPNGQGQKPLVRA